MFKHGVIIGKFYPFHNGHVYLIESAARQCEKVTVVVCTLPTEIYSGRARFRAVTEHFGGSNVLVKHFDTVVPQEPSESPDFWDIWVNIVRTHAIDADVLFTSELYGTPFAQHLGIAQVCVDLNRRTVPISGTLCRSDISRYWDFLPNSTKRMFKKRVVVIGPESTGKSTLVKQLATHYNASYVEEYGREYTDTRKTTELQAQDFLHIAQEQRRREEDAYLKARGLLFCDTDAWTTLRFFNLYNDKGTCAYDYPTHQELVTLAFERPYRYDVTLLTNLDVAWTQDSQRDFGDVRQMVFEDFESYCEDIVIDAEKWCEDPIRPHVLIKGTGDDRLRIAVQAVDQFLKDMD